jgi:hypothetical protein
MRSISTGSLFHLHKNENEMETACGGMIAGGFRPGRSPPHCLQAAPDIVRRCKNQQKRCDKE